MLTIDEKDISDYRVIIDGEAVNLSLLVSRFKEKAREIKFHLDVNKRCDEERLKKS